MTSTPDTEPRHGRGAVVCAFLCGATAGAAIAALFAPATGRDTRERLLSKAREMASRKDEYLAMLEAQLDEWSRTIDALASRARSATNDTRFEYEKQVADLRARRETARRMLGELRTAGEAAWHDLADGADRAWQELRRAVEQAAARLS